MNDFIRLLLDGATNYFHKIPIFSYNAILISIFNKIQFPASIVLKITILQGLQKQPSNVI